MKKKSYKKPKKWIQYECAFGTDPRKIPTIDLSGNITKYKKGNKCN